MIAGMGCDVVNMERLNKSLEFLERFGARILGNDEQKELMQGKTLDKEKFAASLAKRYSAKEAFVKALGTGFRNGIFLADIQVLHNKEGKPLLKISGEALRYMQKLYKEPILHLSISDDYPVAISMVIIEVK
jgi:holo-[acyl-carrier protein] synthase